MSRASDTEDLRRNGFIQGNSDSYDATCGTCESTCNGSRGWYRKTSYEYDEWDCYCRKCAIEWIHQWDDFDFDAAMRELEAKQ
ncbi:hypothetical protein [Planctomycetes bacterium TBK1r]|uniref:Uncharacterized protein n=1 Tax=Stieleria magnilauensis TaxID=2527963 RepID=A0ABX5XY48_9BACT|nr:hypothetical protein TBK1r_59800 [Planctomycetes bacterium TBK1r]QDV87031.1 hypothetical protein TBK1r_60580 [Planctomycetes bacterium TBK1r]